MSRLNRYNVAREFAKKNECELLSPYKDFKNNKSKLVFKCQCGNKFITTMDRFKNRNKRHCDPCGSRNRLEKRRFSFEEVKSYIEDNSNCILLSEEYINSKSSLTLKCECGDIFTTNLNNFKFNSKRHCDRCGEQKIGESSRHSLEQVEQYIRQNSNCKLISKGYINSKTPLIFECECGNLFSTDMNTFKSQNKIQCNKCSIKEQTKLQRKTTEKYKDEVYKLVGDEYTVIGEYIGANNHIRIRHNSSKCNGHVWDIHAGSFLGGTRCPECDRLSKLGVSHPMYNPDLTDEERENNRDLLDNITFRNKVFKRDGYKCKACDRTGRLNAHHLNGYHWAIDERFNIENGVTLCRDCHKTFHSIYGYKYNTSKQFNEFLKNKKSTS